MQGFVKQRVTVIGTGYVGLVTGTCLSHIGHTVVCVDIDEAKVARMQRGKVPIYEPGLDEMFQAELQSGRLTITTDLAAAVTNTNIIFLALPTPQGADGAADLSAVLSVADTLGQLLTGPAVVVTKSTVPVGTGDKIREKLAAHTSVEFDVVSNPEFLREGHAVADCLHPDRIVVGASKPESFERMRQLYAPYLQSTEQMVETDVRSSELTKYAANSFLAMKVSFINEIANLCEKVGADVESVRRGIGPDERIGRQFLQAGIGYGGSCFPKDVEALLYTATENAYDFKLLKSIVTVNQTQKSRLFEKALEYFNGELTGKKIAMWGLAFKPDTDDVRESPAFHTIPKLLEAGASVIAYDPHAIANTKKYFGEKPGLDYATDPMEACRGADALFIVTEWQEFRDTDLGALKQTLAAPVIFDGRNIFEPADMESRGFHYESIGRPHADLP
jgi:UDPglucose 6-dehydrogenase